MERLRPLSEADCYARLYGQRELTVTIISRQPRRPPWPQISGEDLREGFEERLDIREPLGQVDAEAA
jgi:hypothetical protein